MISADRELIVGSWRQEARSIIQNRTNNLKVAVALLCFDQDVIARLLDQLTRAGLVRRL